MLLHVKKSESINFDTNISSKNTILLLSIAYSLVVVTMVTPVLSWILILALCTFVIRVGFYLERQKTSLATRTVNLLAILAAIALAWFSLSLGLLITMVNLLVMACAFKLLRINSPKDIKQLFASILFLTACGFIFHQGIVYVLIYALNTLVLLTALLAFNAPKMSMLSSARYVGVQVAQALPIAIILFLVLPQLPPLWQMPTAKGAKTGLTDQVTPGDIADLSQSSDLAFRAIFDDQTPQANERYWRVMTLEQFDGKTWRQSPIRRQVNRQYRQLNKTFQPEFKGPYWEYEVIAEPSHQNWLFSLDTPQIDSQPDILVESGHEYQLRAQRPVLSTLNYAVKSYYQQPLDQTLYSIDRRINLQQPMEGNPLTREWIAELRQQYTDDSAFIEAVQRFFFDNPFSYTLRPEPMHNNPVDSFLFNQQAGFCAHYASAFAYALRLGGIPARMVTGYQGGEIQVPQVLSVYQYDAHAWVEAWFDERGWVRFDPTAWVAPDRINFGLEQAMREEGSFLADSPLSLARLKNIAVFNQLRLWFANIDYQWSKWVLGFDSKQQEDLLRQLFGELSPQKLSFIGIGVVLVISLLLGLYMLPKITRRHQDPFVQFYRSSTLVVGDKTGVYRQVEAPETYLQRVKSKLSAESYELFKQITQQFSQSQYQPAHVASHSDTAEFKRKVKLLNKQLQKSRS